MLQWIGASACRQRRRVTAEPKLLKELLTGEPLQKMPKEILLVFLNLSIGFAKCLSAGVAHC